MGLKFVRDFFLNNRVCVFISGGGRSLENLILYADKKYQIDGVISSNEKCLGNEIAKKYQIPLKIISFKKENRDQSVEEIYNSFVHWKIDWVVLAGFLKMFPMSEKFLAWQNKIINIHPALLPEFGGRGMYGSCVHEAVLRAKKKESGATVHFVNEKYDEGKIISQIRVPVLENDNEQSLAERVFKAECQLLPETLNKLVLGS